MTVGERIRKIRQNKKMSQSELGNKLNVSQAMIAQYENGKRLPKNDTLFKIATALDVNMTDLLYDELVAKKMQELIDNEFYKKYNETLKEQYLINKFRLLNESGQEEAAKRVEELTEIRRYVVIENNDNQPKEQLKRLSEYSNKLNAAHSIKDSTEEDKQHDEDIMNDDDF